MADNKNQHYVPRILLKPFTLGSEGNAINLLNIDRMKAIRNAPVKNQCSGDYFYGNDEKLEKAINSVETSYAAVTKNLIRTTPAINPETRIILLRFAYLQHLRTEAAARKGAEMTRALLDVPGADIPTPSVKEEIKSSVQIAMLHFADTMSMVDDLKVCLVVNRSIQPFITSDDPAILTNRLHLQRGHRLHRKNFGAITAGAIFLMPITPHLCTIAYDAAVYELQHSNGIVDTTRVSDITAINQHQILNCAANLYYRDWEIRNKLIEQVASIKDLRPKQRHEIVHATLKERTEWGSHYVVKEIQDLKDEEEILVHVKTNHPKPSAWPSFLRFRPGAKAYSNGTGAGLTRKWCIQQGYVTGTGYRKLSV
ncbi:DUF4238 domain-containing protein [Rhodopseudomonas sp. P1]|uniref:DUF4238 domain-containing protein n=1 Tax=Rhodopseudomonas sp. P1 TaxID=3434357 RepID=UPI0031FDEDD2